MVVRRNMFLVAEERGRLLEREKKLERGRGLEGAFQREGAWREREEKGFISLHFPGGKFFTVTHPCSFSKMPQVFPFTHTSLTLSFILLLHRSPSETTQ